MDRWLEVVREALDLKVKYHETAPEGSNESRDLDDAKMARDLAFTMRLNHLNVEHTHYSEMEIKMEFSSYNTNGSAHYFMGGRRHIGADYIPW